MSIEACQTPNKFHVNSFGNEFTLGHRLSLVRMSAGNRYNARFQKQKKTKIIFYCRTIRIYSLKATKFKRFSRKRKKKKRTSKRKSKNKKKMIVIRRSKIVTAVEFLRTKSKLSKVNGICAT